MKSLRVSLFVLLLVLGVCSARGEGEDRVTAQIRAFYQWYVPLLQSGGQDEEILRHHRKEMSGHVTVKLLAKIARFPADSQEGDYFVKSLDADRDWVKNLVVDQIKVDAKGRATATVLLTAKATGRIRIKVTLMQEGGTYKISEVENLPDNGYTAAARLRAFYGQYLHYRAYASADETLTGRQDVRESFTKAGLAKATADTMVDYLVQSSDLDPQWEDQVEVKPTGFNPDDTQGTVEVLLTGEKIPKAHLRVLLKPEGNDFKIDGVEKIND